MIDAEATPYGAHQPPTMPVPSVIGPDSETVRQTAAAVA
jgi:hypothetical protein